MSVREDADGNKLDDQRWSQSTRHRVYKGNENGFKFLEAIREGAIILSEGGL